MPRDILVTSIKQVLTEFPFIYFGTLFGSACSGRMTASSDVDIAVAGKEQLTVEQRLDLSSRLSQFLGREVDLIDLNQVSGLILEQALCRSVVIWNEEPEIYADLLKKLWYNQADMMPYIRRILDQRTTLWLQ